MIYKKGMHLEYEKGENSSDAKKINLIASLYKEFIENKNYILIFSCKNV